MAVADVPQFEAEGTKEASAPYADKKGGAEKDDGVQTDEIAMRPVNTFAKVEPEGELI